MKNIAMKNIAQLATLFSFGVLFLASQILSSQSAMALTPDKLMGQGLFEQQGGNSCLFCHGIDGTGGNVADAAKLNNPRSWKAWKAVGGDAAYNADPKAFIAKLKDATVALLETGAIRHNASYKNEAFDWSKIEKYNSQMMGISGAASIAWIKKYKNRGMTPKIAAQGLWIYLAELDKESVLKAEGYDQF